MDVDSEITLTEEIEIANKPKSNITMIQYLPNTKILCLGFQSGVTIICKYDGEGLRATYTIPPLGEIGIGLSGCYIRFTEMAV